MGSPVSDFLERIETVETRPTKLGEQVYEITLPLGSWNYMDKMLWSGCDIQLFLNDCAENIIDDDPSYTLHLWLYWVATGQWEKNGLNLKVRD